jgi:hypothetical protein
LIRVEAGRDIEERKDRGWEAILLLLNGGGRSKSFTLPCLDSPGTWAEVLETSGSQVPVSENRVSLAPHSLMLLRRDLSTHLAGHAAPGRGNS